MYRVHSFGVFHIHKVDDVELTAFWQFPQLLVLLVVVVQFGSQGRELVVVNDHGKTFCTVLTDERLYNRKSLTATRRTHYPGASERVHDVYPSFAEFTLIVVAHRDIHAVFVIFFLLALLETLVFKVETVFHQSFFQELRNVVQGYMHQHRSDDGCHHI